MSHVYGYIELDAGMAEGGLHFSQPARGRQTFPQVSRGGLKFFPERGLKFSIQPLPVRDDHSLTVTQIIGESIQHV